MFDTSKANQVFSDVSKLYGASVENFVKVCDLNTNSLQNGMKVQSQLVSECVNLTSGNVSKFTNIKSPKDLESCVVDSAKQTEKFALENTNKVLDFYKNYAEQINAIFNCSIQTSNEVAKAVVK